VTFTVPSPSGTGNEYHVWPGSAASVSVTGSSGGTSDTGVLAINATGNVRDYYDNTGISSNTDEKCADLDGDGYSFSSNALASAGVTPGGSVTSGGVTFTWPARSTCKPDDMLAAGQTLRLHGTASDTKIGFLGTSTNGASSGPVVIHYTDGSTSTARLQFSDWAGSAVAGENTVASIPYRNSITGVPQTLTISVYEVSLPLKAGKTVSSLTLPYIGDSIAGVTAMHIFAVGLG
jgi:beta-glucosidase